MVDLNEELDVLTRLQIRRRIAELSDVRSVAADPTDLIWRGPERRARPSTGIAFVSRTIHAGQVNVDPRDALCSATFEFEVFGYATYAELGPEEMTLDAALAWARERATRVELRATRRR